MKVLIIVLLLMIFLLSINLYFIENKKEGYMTYLESIKFLNKDLGRKLLNSDIKYFDTLDKNDLLARKINEDIKKYYSDGLMVYTDDEKRAISWLIKNCIDRLKEEYHFLFKNISLGKFSDYIENTFPHTHKDCIFFHESFLKRLVNYYKLENVKEALKYYGNTLIHECVHIWQRKNKKGFNDLYNNFWFFKKGTIDDSEGFIKNTRKNPDGVELDWVFNKDDNPIWVLSLFNTDGKLNMSNVSTKGIKLKETENNYYEIDELYPEEDIRDIEVFTDFFGIGPNNYHPNELSADMIANYLTHIMSVTETDLTTPAMISLTRWLKKQI